MMTMAKLIREVKDLLSEVAVQENTQLWVFPTGLCSLGLYLIDIPGDDHSDDDDDDDGDDVAMMKM